MNFRLLWKNYYRSSQCSRVLLLHRQLPDSNCRIDAVPQGSKTLYRQDSLRLRYRARTHCCLSAAQMTCSSLE
jgi:hypothetical protein